MQPQKDKFIFLAVFPFLLIALLFANLSFRPRARTISLLYAGSLLNLFEEDLKPKFEKKTNLSLQGEGHGALTCARLIKENLRSPDLFITADTQVIRNELMGKKNGNLVRGYLVFVSNRMVIAYSQKSRFYSELEKARRGEIPWYEVLTKPGFRFGRTDPNLNPKGYRMIFVAELAEKYYRKPGLAKALLGNRHGSQVYEETELMSRLEIGDVDAVESYANEAIERKLPFIELPPQINLGDPDFEDVYKGACFRASTGRVYRGSPILFALTIPEKAKNREGAIKLANFILSPEGLQIFEQHGFQIVKPQVVGEFPLKLLNRSRKND